MPSPTPEPATLYLDLLARCLTRDLFLDEEVRNVDLRDWPGGEPDGLRALLRERRWRVVRPGADRETRAVGNDWPPHAETMVGLARLANVRDCTVSALTDGVPGDLVETGVWRGGYVIVDDYHGIGPCRQAVTDHRAAHGITAAIHDVDWTAVWWRKP